MIWLVGARGRGGGGALPTMACMGYLLQASGMVGTSLVDVYERLKISVA